MALTVTSAKRIFKFDDKELDDPNSNLSIEEVKKFYAGKYPELTNASISGPKMENDKAVYTLGVSIGKKG